MGFKTYSLQEKLEKEKRSPLLAIRTKKTVWYSIEIKKWKLVGNNTFIIHFVLLGQGVGPMGCRPGSSGGPSLPQPIDGGGSQVTMSSCETGPCLYGSTCIPLANSFMCICAPGQYFRNKFIIS